jgi:hypothetical protein
MKQFDWSQMGLSIILMVIMAFFCTGGVEVFKDVYYYWLCFITSFTNRWRTPDKKKIVTEEDKYFNETASKFISFCIALWMCYAFDYGAIDDIVQYGVHSKGSWAIFTDYILTAAIIRLGAVQVYDLLAMLTEKAIAAKALAQKLTSTEYSSTTKTTTTSEKVEVK